MKHLMPRAVLMSAYQSDKPLGVNMLAQADLIKVLDRDHARFTSLTGCYAGVLEESVAVFPESDWQVLWLLQLANSFGQESILVREMDGSCFLIFCRGGTRSQEYIGQWTQISEQRALSLVAYSKKGNTFFAAI